MVNSTLEAVGQAVDELTAMALMVGRGNARILVTVALESDTRNQAQQLYAETLRLKVEGNKDDCLAVGYNGIELFFHEDKYRWGKKELYLTGKEKLNLYEHFIERRRSSSSESRLLDKKLRKKFGSDFPSIL
jgi:hypothetical protein